MKKILCITLLLEFLHVHSLFPQNSYAADDSIFSIEFFYGGQILAQESVESLYKEMLDLRIDKLDYLPSSNNVESNPIYSVGIRYVIFERKVMFGVIRVSQIQFSRETKFSLRVSPEQTLYKTSKIQSSHRLYPIIVGAGYFVRGNGATLIFEIDAIYSFGKITETSIVDGYKPVSSEIKGAGIGFQLGASLGFRLFRNTNLLLEGNYSLISHTYTKSVENYTGNRAFGYYGFGLRVGLAYTLF